MKKQFISSFGLGLFILLLVNNAQAQNGNIKDLPPVVITGATTNVTEQVANSFQRYFKDASNVRWFEQNKKYLVKFILNDQENRALMNSKGRLIYHISYGEEKHLPADIRRSVKYGYVDYQITRAIRVHEGNRTIWVINLEDEANLVLVRSEQGELEEVEKYRKPAPLVNIGKQ